MSKNYGLLRNGKLFTTAENVYPMFTPKRKTLDKVLIIKRLNDILVIPLGLEPRTPTLKVLCSTD